MAFEVLLGSLAVSVAFPELLRSLTVSVAFRVLLGSLAVTVAFLILLGSLAVRHTCVFDGFPNTSRAMGFRDITIDPATSFLGYFELLPHDVYAVVLRPT